MPRFGDVYEIPCKQLGMILREKNQKLWEEIQGSQVGDDPNLWLIPDTKMEEAKRRHSVVAELLSKYNKTLHSSRLKVYVLIHQINDEIKHLDFMQGQLSFFENEEKEREEEKKKLVEFKRVIRDIFGYYSAVHVR